MSLLCRLRGCLSPKTAQRFGEYELSDTNDIAEAVKATGGLRGSQTRNLPILVSRLDSGNDRISQFPTQLPLSSDIPVLALRNSDGVHIPTANELERSVSLAGAIKGASRTDEATGIMRLRYKQGDTVRTLPERAGGLGPGADFRGSNIARAEGNEKTIIPLELEALLIYRDAKAHRPCVDLRRHPCALSKVWHRGSDQRGSRAAKRRQISRTLCA
jgi:hypothetical protein